MAAPLVKESRFLDEFGVQLEKMGLPKDLGRLWGWMLICEPPCQTLDEIAQALALDRGTVGKMAELLVGYNLAERIELPGKTCFALKPLEQMMQQRMAWLDDFVKTLDQSLEGMEGRYERLRDLRNLYALINAEIPRIIARWEAQKQ